MADSHEHGSEQRATNKREPAPGGAPAAGAGPAAGATPAAAADDESLGSFLRAERERRGVGREDAAAQTRIPPHYLQMIERNDYSAVADQLYVLPFVRRYAAFLQLDPEEIAMRFVSEVQRADGSPGDRIDRPLDSFPRRHRGRTRGLAIAVAVIVIVGVYFYLSSARHRAAADTAGINATVSDQGSLIAHPPHKSGGQSQVE